MCTDSCELITVNMSDWLEDIPPGDAPRAFQNIYGEGLPGILPPMQAVSPQVPVAASVSDDVPVSQSSGINYRKGARMLGNAALNAGLSALIGYGLTELVKKMQKKKSKKQGQAFKKGGVVKKKAGHKKTHKKAGKR